MIYIFSNLFMSPFWFSFCFDDLSPSALIWFSTFSDLLLWLYIVLPNSKNSNWINSLLFYINELSKSLIQLFPHSSYFWGDYSKVLLRSVLSFYKLETAELKSAKTAEFLCFLIIPNDLWVWWVKSQSPADLRSNPVCCSLHRNTAYVNWILISVTGRKDGCGVRLQFPIGVERGEVGSIVGLWVHSRRLKHIIWVKQNNVAAELTMAMQYEV